MFIPALIIFSSISTDLQAGPVTTHITQNQFEVIKTAETQR